MDRDIVKDGAALCIGVAALAFGVPGASLATALSGSALTSALFARFWKGRRDLREVETAQAACREGYLELARREGDLAEIESMDTFLNRAISAVEITRPEMEALVPGGDFKRAATDLLLARMGVDASGRPDLARRYARDLIEAGLRQAMTREAFLRTLQLEAIFSIQREIDGLHDKVDGLDQKIRNDVPRSLLESLVQRFEHDNPDAPVPELEAFLKEKAKEWKDLKARLAVLEAGNARLANVRNEAEAAMERADFDAARALLDSAAEIGTDVAVDALREVADIRALMAETWLLQGDADAAAASFEDSAMLFTSIDRTEETQRRREGAMRLADNGARFGGSGLTHATQLHETNLDVHERLDNTVLLAETYQMIGDLLRQQAELRRRPQAIDLLDRSDGNLNKSLDLFLVDQFPVGWSKTKFLMGNNFVLRASIESRDKVVQTNLENAIKSYESAIDVPSLRSTTNLFASCQNGLGNALHEMSRTSRHQKAFWLQRAVDAYNAALKIWTEADFPLQWAKTENNLANTVRILSDLAPGSDGTDLLKVAVKRPRSTLQVRTLEDFPLHWAATKNNLGAAAARLGERLGHSHGADLFLFLEAKAAFSDSQEVYSRAHYPARFATANANIGRVLENMGDRYPAERAARYTEALASYDLALEVFGPTERDPFRAQCASNRAGLMRKLAALR